MPDSPTTTDAALETWLLVREQEVRWSAALRAAAACTPSANARIASEPQLPSVSTLLGVGRPVVVCLEITGGNLTAQLDHLAALRGAPMVGLVGLLDGVSLAGNKQEAERLALEAGAAVVIGSPRDCPTLLNLAARHAERATRWAARRTPLQQQLWDRLPWQSAPWAIGSLQSR